MILKYTYKTESYKKKSELLDCVCVLCQKRIMCAICVYTFKIFKKSFATQDGVVNNNNNKKRSIESHLRVFKI